MPYPDYPPLGPFATLYEEWTSAYPHPRDPAIAARLKAMYRDAWAAGNWLEREYILYFIYDRKDHEGADLIVEGLKSDDHRLAGVAATLTSVTHKRILNLGAALRPAFRKLVRRFPEKDITRPRDLYGHEAGDLDDWRQRPFLNLYEDWMADCFPRDPAIADQLYAISAETWATGDAVDRAFVTMFMTYHRATGHADDAELVTLIREGLQTSDPRLARTAAFEAWSSTKDGGLDLGPDLRDIIESHLQRFPEHTGPATYILQDLRPPPRRRVRRR